MIIETTHVNEDGERTFGNIKKFSDSMNGEGYRFPVQKMGARMFSDVQFPAAMSDSEIGKMARLSKLMIGKTNMLGYRTGHKIEAYTAQEIGALVGLKDRQARTFINKMVFLRVVQRVETASGQQFYINPAYFMASGQRLSLDLFLLFREELKNIVPGWVMIEFLRQARTKQTPKQTAQEVTAND